MNALLIDPPFKEYHLIDLDSEKVDSLRTITKEYPNVKIYEGDCNKILVEDIFPRAQYEDYRRALCLLDPYGLHLNWGVVFKAGQMKSIDIFMNFPLADMNRNVLWRNPEKVDEKQASRMTAYWGDESWKQVAYTTTTTLFGWEQKADNQAIVDAFRGRLKNIAGFANIPEPIPMRNRKGAVIYYLFFASQKPIAAEIVTDIFNKYRNKGVS